MTEKEIVWSDHFEAVKFKSENSIVIILIYKTTLQSQNVIILTIFY